MDFQDMHGADEEQYALLLSLIRLLKSRPQPNTLLIRLKLKLVLNDASLSFTALFTSSVDSNNQRN